jgi:hypothetical protein
MASAELRDWADTLIQDNGVLPDCRTNNSYLVRPVGVQCWRTPDRSALPSSVPTFQPWWIKPTDRPM